MVLTSAQDLTTSYALCTQDRVIPLAKQQETIINAQAIQPTAFDMIGELEVWHKPFLSAVDALAKLVAKSMRNRMGT